MTQYARPDGDDTITQFADEGAGTTNIYLSINEITPDDGDYVASNANQPATYICNLSNVDTPLVKTGHSFKIRLYTSKNNKALSWSAEIRQGTTTIASTSGDETNPGSSPTTITTDLSEAQANNIDNYNDLKVYVNVASATAGNYLIVTWIEFSCPDGEEASYTSFKTPIGNYTKWTWKSGQYGSDSGMRAIDASGTKWMWALISSSANYYYPSGSETKWKWVQGNT